MTVMPVARPANGRFAVDPGHLLLEQDVDAHCPRCLFERADKTGAACGGGRLVRPVHDVQPRAAVAVEPVGRAAVAFPLDAVLLQPVEQVEIVVGPNPDELAVAEPAHRLLRPRPVGEREIGGVLDPLRLLQPVAAADIEAAIAHHGAAADVEVLLHDDDRGTLLTGRDRGDEPACPGTDHDDVGLAVPGDAVRRRGLAPAAQRRRPPRRRW